MNYRLSNFEIKTAQGARISGQESNGYLSCTAFNPMNRFEKPHNVAIFHKATVEYYKSKLPISKGGLLPDEGWDENAMNPQDRIFINGCTVEYDLGALYCRKYTADIIDANGVVIPGKEAGKIICDINGNPIVFSKIPVFCQYAFKTEAVFDDYGMPIIDPNTGASKVKIIRDDSGRPIEEWVAGWSPVEVGESMRRLLTPYDATLANSQVAEQVLNPQGGPVHVEESPQIFNNGAQAAAQPATQPAAQQ